MSDERGPRGEIMELGHEPWPGFRKAFAVVFAAACLYLAALLWTTVPEAGEGTHPPPAAGEHAR